MTGSVWSIILGSWPHAISSLMPVCLFLAGLAALDSFKLVRLRQIAAAILAGGGAALVSFVGETTLVAGIELDVQAASRYVAPLVEEAAKAAFVVFVIRTGRVGFVVDAALLGFATGTGFALAENIYYLQSQAEPGLLTWILRGVGTAVMHGGATALFAMICKSVYDRRTAADAAGRPSPAAGPFGLPDCQTSRAAGLFGLPYTQPSPAAGVPGLPQRRPSHAARASHHRRTLLIAALPALGLSCVVHGIFNHFLLPPLAMTALLVTVLPALIGVVFHRSERATSRWLGTGFDTDQMLLDHLVYGSLQDDRVGRYLHELRRRFRGEIVADMLCLVRLRAELSIKAKGLMLMRKAGFRPRSPDDVADTLEEIRHLETRIGPTGMLALNPVLRREHRERWQLHQLEMR